MLNIDDAFKEFPVLETDRLILRRIEDKDARVFYRMYSDKEVMKYFGKELFSSFKQAEDKVKLEKSAFETKEAIRWAITLKPEDDMIGSGGFWKINKEHYRAEIGYDLLPDFHRRGIMSEAVKVMIEFGFTKMKLHSIEANTDPENKSSNRMLEKLGFKLEGNFRENYFFNGKFLDTFTFSLINKNQ